MSQQNNKPNNAQQKPSQQGAVSKPQDPKIETPKTGNAKPAQK